MNAGVGRKLIRWLHLIVRFTLDHSVTEEIPGTEAALSLALPATNRACDISGI
jgi:hypothetical protein